MILEGTKEPAVIEQTSFGVEPDRRLCVAQIDFRADDSGWRQAFQMVVQEKHVDSVRRAILKTFDVSDPGDLNGLSCHVLRNQPYGVIVGLEAPSGKRFTRFQWCRENIDPNTPNEYAQRAMMMQREIEHHLSAILRVSKDLLNLRDKFVDWELEP